MLCAYTRPRYQVSVYTTIGPLDIYSGRGQVLIIKQVLCVMPGNEHM